MSKILTTEQIQALHDLSEAIRAAQAAIENDFPNYSARLEAILDHTNDIREFAKSGKEVILCGKCAVNFEIYHRGFWADKLRDITRGKENCSECGRRHYCGIYRIAELPY